MTVIERRPDVTGRNKISYPRRWGKPPEDPAKLAEWRALNIRLDVERRDGERG